jgi:isoleucyl-tRNA synthetase
LKLRQPLRRLVVQGATVAPKHVEEIRDELRVKEVEFRDVGGAFVVSYKPNLPSLGRKGLGQAIPAIREALARGEVEPLDGGGFRVAGHELEPEDVLVEVTSEPGWQVVQQDGLLVALDTTLDPELEREADVLDLIHHLNTLRKEAGLELSDRIRLTLPRRYEELREYEERIREETLAVEVVYADVPEPEVAKL